MSRFANAVRFVRARSTTKQTRLALDDASWHANLAGLEPFEIAVPVEPAPVVHLNYTACHTSLIAANRKAAWPAIGTNAIAVLERRTAR
jgi:hypothetical protein